MQPHSVHCSGVVGMNRMQAAHNLRGPDFWRCQAMTVRQRNPASWGRWRPLFGGAWYGARLKRSSNILLMSPPHAFAERI